MKNNIIMFLLFSILISCSQDRKANASIEVDKEVNIGNVKLFDTISKTIELSNTSNVDLRIKQIKTSCGCTIVSLKDSTLKPRETTEVKIQFVADSENIGIIKKSVVIEANTNPNFTVVYLNGLVK